MIWSTLQAQIDTRQELLELPYLEHLIDDQIDICVITEIWLNNLDPTIISDLNREGYIFKPFPRSRKGGGLAISYRDTIDIKQLDSSEEDLPFEYVHWRVTANHFSFSLIGVYHPPPSATNKTTNQQFIDKLAEILMPIATEQRNVVILGDFNIHVNDQDDLDNILLQDWLEASGLINHVTFPTHISGNTLDLVLTKQQQSLHVLSTQQGISFFRSF